MRLIVTAMLLLLAQPLPALAAPARADAARNLADFDFVVAKIETNYAGFPTKVTAANRADYAALTGRLRARAATATDAELTAILTEWIGFFRDGHTQVSANGAAPAAIKTPRLPWREPDVRARLAALGTARDPVEGIWQLQDRYRLAVLRTDKAAMRFAAVVLATTSDAWQPGEVKADLVRSAPGAYRMVYRAGDHGAHDVVPTLVAAGDAIDLGADWGVWTRVEPAPADPEGLARRYPSGLFLKRLSPTTLWLRIPDFNDSRAKPLLAELAAHQADLAAAPNLVIDLRRNGGGSDYVYAPILPLLYTRPVVTIGIEMRASADNIALRQAIADRIRAEAPEPAAGLDAQNTLMAAHIGSFVQPDPQPFSIDRQPKVLPYPRHVAVLIDHAGSTGEQFLLDARQSRKVTLMGQSNSAGVLDFANVVAMPTPSGRFEVQWATSRSLRVPADPVDPDGIAPDVRIPADVGDPVAWAQAWLERQPAD
ncbi:MAG: hypothetical protein RL490_2725 [Pseudomonadota bacterium]